MMFIGIDPGQSGGMAILHEGGLEIPSIYPFLKMTERDIHVQLNDARESYPDDQIFAMLEKVGAFPGQGVSSTWKFGQHYGFLRGILTAQGIPFELVRPQVWQTAMGCLTKGDKNVSKAAAQRLFPSIKMTHAIADAVLIAEYCRRTVNSRTAKAVLA